MSRFFDKFQGLGEGTISNSPNTSKHLDLRSFNERFAEATELYGSYEFWRTITDRQKSKELLDFSREQFLSGFMRPVDGTVLDEVNRQLNSGKTPYIVEIDCGFSIVAPHNNATRSPWLSRRLAYALGTELVLATNLNKTMNGYVNYNTQLPLNPVFERSIFNLNVGPDTDPYRLNRILRKGEADIIFGRYLDPMTFDLQKFMRGAFPVLSVGGKAILEILPLDKSMSILPEIIVLEKTKNKLSQISTMLLSFFGMNLHEVEIGMYLENIIFAL